VATRLGDRSTTSVVERRRPDPTPAREATRAPDLCDACPHSWTDRLGRERLAGLHPILVGAVVAAVGYVLLALCAVGAGLLLTDVVLPGAVQEWDVSVVRTLVEPRPDLNDPSLVGSYLSEFATVLAVGGIVVAISLWRRWFRLAVLFTVAICTEGAVYVATTYFVSRVRPSVPRLEHLIVTDSFPSGHVAAGVVLWFSVALLVWNATQNRWLRGAAVIAVAVAPIVIALSRMYRGMHYPTDAIAGYLIGWGCVALAIVTVRTAGAAADRRREQRGAR
jgi:membrane-associated phospholipid phosphatase